MKITKIYKNKNEYVVTLRDDDHAHYNYFGKSLKSAIINLVIDVVYSSNFWYTSDTLVREYTYKILHSLSNVDFLIAKKLVKKDFNKFLKVFSFVSK